MTPAQVPPVPGAGDPQRGQDVETPTGAAVAGVAREVDALRRAVEPLLGLPGRVDDLTRLAADLADAVAALTARRPAAACQSWLLLPADPDLAARLLDELIGWLARVYLRYPDGAAHLPECWAWHPDVVEELLWLLHAWATAYQGPQASVALVGDWHDRQRPGVVRRIRQSAGACSLENHTTRPGWDHLSGAAPQAPGTDRLPVLAEWWATRREQPAPEPAPRLSAVPHPADRRGRR